MIKKLTGISTDDLKEKILSKSFDDARIIIIKLVILDLNDDNDNDSIISELVKDVRFHKFNELISETCNGVLRERANFIKKMYNQL